MREFAHLGSWGRRLARSPVDAYAEKVTTPPDPKADPDAEDVVLVQGMTEDGGGLRVVRKREEKVESGEIRAVVEGRPLAGDLVKLRPREEHPLLFDVHVEYAADEAPTAARKGPPKVSTAPYREGWEAIWGDDPPTSELPN